MRQVLVAAFILGAVATAAGQSPAQPPPPSAAQPGRAEPSTDDVVPAAQLADMLDTYAIVQAQHALSIDDEKYGLFAARLKKVQDIRRRTQRGRIQIIRELRRLAGPQATAPFDEAAIKTQLKALRDLDERAAVDMRQAYDALDEVLDARQQARFRIFEEQIERRKLDLLVRAQERARQKQAIRQRP
jgi:hypothetical protein